MSIGDFLADSWLALLLTMAIAYLLGSLNSAIIVTKLTTKQDIRTYGSGNAGATNVLRSQGKVPALLTTLGDLLKSFIAVIIGGALLTNLHMAGVEPLYELPGDISNLLVGRYLAGLFCIIGHLFPVYFGFKGGKGVLTTLGMMLILDWRVALICLGFFIVVVLISRMVSLGSVVAAALLPVFTYIFRAFVEKQSGSTVIFCTAMAVLIAAILIIKHIPNIKRICAGTESKFSFGSKNKEPKA